MVSLRVNGRPVELAGPTPLLEYVRGLGVDPAAIAVEVNGEILDRGTYASCTLRDGDVVEIVRMVGGGRGPRPAPGRTGTDVSGRASSRPSPSRAAPRG